MIEVSTEIAVTLEQFVRAFAMFHGSNIAVPGRVDLGDQEWDDLDSELCIEGYPPDTLRGVDHYVRESTPGPRGGLTHAWVRRVP